MQALLDLCVTLVALLHGIAATAGPGCQPQPRIVEFTTDDGSRFLLVTSGLADPAAVEDVGTARHTPPIVHWVMLTPSGDRIDPPGFEGLSSAVARAAMNGTIDHGSREPERERELLAELDVLEQQVAEARFEGRPVATELAEALQRARAAAAAVADPLAWQRAVRAVPAKDIDLDETADATLLAITTTPSGLLRCAILLWDRRENAMLRGLHEQFRRVRSELAATQRGVSATLRREARGLAYVGYAARPIEDHPPPLRRATASEVFASTHHPRRTFNVLTGRFDPERAESLLRRVFARTRLVPTLRPTPIVPAGSRERVSVIPDSPRQAIALCYRLSTDMPVDTLAVFAEWLAGGSGGYLASRLRAEGIVGVTVTYQLPFPGAATPGALFVEVVETTERPDGAAPLPLLEKSRAILGRAAKNPPSEDALQRAIARVAGRRALALADSGRWAAYLAVECGLRGHGADEAMRPLTAPTSIGVQSLAEEVLSEANHTVVSLERKR